MMVILNIESAFPEKTRMELFDLQGRMIFEKRLVSGEIVDFFHFANGGYMYRLSV